MNNMLCFGIANVIDGDEPVAKNEKEKKGSAHIRARHTAHSTQHAARSANQENMF